MPVAILEKEGNRLKWTPWMAAMETDGKPWVCFKLNSRASNLADKLMNMDYVSRGTGGIVPVLIDYVVVVGEIYLMALS